MIVASQANILDTGGGAPEMDFHEKGAGNQLVDNGGYNESSYDKEVCHSGGYRYTN